MLRFTKSIKIKKLFYLMNSILITICTLFAESKMQKFIDSKIFNIHILAIIYPNDICHRKSRKE